MLEASNNLNNIDKECSKQKVHAVVRWIMDGPTVFDPVPLSRFRRRSHKRFEDRRGIYGNVRGKGIQCCINNDR